jgi:hypothetical protein
MSIINTLLSFQNLLQIYHWQTNNYSRHEVIGNLYKTMSGLNDKFIETYQSRKKLRIGEENIIFRDMNDEDLYNVLENMIDYLNNLNLKKMKGLANIRDEMIMEINRSIFLLDME